MPRTSRPRKRHERKNRGQHAVWPVFAGLEPGGEKIPCQRDRRHGRFEHRRLPVQIFDDVNAARRNAGPQHLEGELLVVRGVRRIVEDDVKSRRRVCQRIKVPLDAGIAADKGESLVPDVGEIAYVEAVNVRSGKVFRATSRWTASRRFFPGCRCSNPGRRRPGRVPGN